MSQGSTTTGKKRPDRGDRRVRGEGGPRGERA